MKLKEIKVDLNTLFSFNFNFDSLKIMLENMYNNQNEMIMKLNELDKIVNSYHRHNKRNILDKNISKQNNNYFNQSSKQPKMQLDKGEGEGGDEEESEIDQKELKTIEEGIEDNQNESNKERDNNDDNDLATLQNIEGELYAKNEESIDLSNNKEIKDLYKRVSTIEKSIKQMPYIKTSENKQPSIIISQQKIHQSIDSDSIIKQIKEINDKLISLSLNYEEMNTKVNKINISDLLNECKTDGGSIDLSKVLIANLEQKIFKKFSFMDEKHKQISDDHFKTNKTLNDITMKFEANELSIDQLGKQYPLLNDMMKDINNHIDHVEFNLNEKINKRQQAIIETRNEVKGINECISKLKDNIDRIAKEPKKTGTVMNDNDLQIIKEQIKRVNDLEQGLQNLGQSVNLDIIKDDISKLKADINRKSNNTDVYDLTDKLNVQGNAIAGLKDVNERLIEDRNKLNSDSNLVMKKLESLNASVISIKANEESNLLLNKANIFDTSKFLEISMFNDFLKASQREHDKLIREDDDLRRAINDINALIKTKATDEDMKNIESCFNSRLEEIKFFMNKKYAEKNDTYKSLKYLDTQLKHIIDYYLKKNDKGENWLLAKKPIGGFSCASCETYIGELPEKKDYLAWNKYPMRESQDKAYRIGNGYSKLLSMLNVDIKNPLEGATFDNQSESDGEAKDGTKGLHCLPNIASNKGEEHVNMSVDLSENTLRKTIDANEPKVVRIIKRSKNKSMDITRNGK